MEKINRYDSHVIRTKQWMAILLLAIPMGVHALGMLGLASAFAGKLPINSISYLLPALGFFFLWQIASNTATRIAAKIETIIYAAWAIYFTLLELIGIDNLPVWMLYAVIGAQISTPLIFAYTASLVGQNNRLKDIEKFSIWVLCIMCIFESYWAVANSPISLWLFDGMAANNISVSAFKEVYRWFVISLDILAAIALGIICRSGAFIHTCDPNEPDPKYTPMNRYTIVTVAITFLLIALS